LKSKLKPHKKQKHRIMQQLSRKQPQYPVHSGYFAYPDETVWNVTHNELPGGSDIPYLAL